MSAAPAPVALVDGDRFRDLDLERAVVGALILHPDLMEPGVEDDLFFDAGRKVLTATAMAPAQRLAEAPLGAVVEVLAARGDLAVVGGPAGVTAYIEDGARMTGADIAAGVARLRELRCAREHYRAALAIVPAPCETDGADVGSEPPVAPRPPVILRNELNSVTGEYERALLDHAGLYQRARQLVRVVRDPGHQARDLVRPAGAPTIQPVTLAGLRGMMDTATNTVRSVGKGVRPALPPMWAAETLASQASWPFPVLSGVVESPVLRPDGTVLDKPGYDGAIELLYEPNATFPPVPQQPTQADAREAVAAICEPLADFPWVDECGRAAAIAAVLTLVGRAAIPGCVPLFAVRATAPASGKGLLVDTIVSITTGRAPARTTYPRDPEEMRKKITAIASEAHPAVLIDNADRVLGNDVLAAMLTARTWEDRVLGTQTNVTLPLNMVWFVTGNGLTFKGDTARRVVPIDLDPRCEHPEDRTGFTHPDLLAWVQENRPMLLVAALTILRAFHLAGRPRHGGPRIGSFEAWDDEVRSALIWAGLPDPTAARQRIREEDDADLSALREALAAAEQVYGTAPFTVADVIAKTTGKNVGEPELRAALLALTGRDELAPHALGVALRRTKGRVAGGLWFDRAQDDSHRKVVRWLVAGNAGNGGNDSDPKDQNEEEEEKGQQLETFPQPPPFPAGEADDMREEMERLERAEVQA